MRHPNPHLPYETWIPGAAYPFVPPNSPPIAAPICRSTPYAGVEGPLVYVTMGEWTGTPTSYAYAWSRDGTPIVGATSSTYTPVAADKGHALTCIVTATNGIGSTPAPASNPISVPATFSAEEAMSDTVPGDQPEPEPSPVPVGDEPEDPKPKAARHRNHKS